MKKIHLRNSFCTTACGIDSITLEETIDINHDNLCNNCKRTNQYKQAKAEQKKTEHEKLKAELLAPVKNKMVGKISTNHGNGSAINDMVDVTLKLAIPKGFEFDEVHSQAPRAFNDGGAITSLEIMFKPKVKNGGDLIDCLVGYSDTSMEDAKNRAETLNYIGYCRGVKLSHNPAYLINGTRHYFCYPVPCKKLKELARNLES